MRRVTAGLALAICLFGCSSEPSGERVELATTDLSVAENGCYTIAWEYYLAADLKYGTRYTEHPDGSGGSPLYWPTGYTGWRVGSEVEVRDLTGKVVAVTGRRYQIYMGATPQGANPAGLVTSGICMHEIPSP